MTRLTEIEETAAHYAGRPLEELYREAGMHAGPTRIVALVADRPWPPRLLLALDACRRGVEAKIPGSQEAQAELRALGIPLIDRHLAESPLRTG